MKRIRRAVACLACGCAVAVSARPEAAPYVGMPWTIVLCTFSDSPTPPPDRVDYFRRAFATRGTQGVADYLFDVSMGRVRLDEVASVIGWYQMPVTEAAWAAIARGGPGGDRPAAFRQCVTAAQAQGAVIPPRSLVAVLTRPGRDLTGWPGAAIINDDGSSNGWAHELGHALGLWHSFAEYRYPGTSAGATVAEYGDPFDIMSWNFEVFALPPGPFGAGGPRFNAFHLDALGFLREHNVLTFGTDGAVAGTYTLTPLYAAGTGGVRAIRVPLDRFDPLHYLSIELRQADSWDAATGTPLVLVHEVRRRWAGGPPASYLLREAGSRRHLTAVARGGISVAATFLPADGTFAVLQIASPMATECMPQAVKRDGGSRDTACVWPSVRDRTEQENVRSANFRLCLRNCNLPLPAVPVYACRPGYVERGAFPEDRTCVTRVEADQARLDSKASPALTNPTRLVNGPNTCGPGFVWRKADDRDFVCVTPQVRLETQQENTSAPRRIDLRPEPGAARLDRSGAGPWPFSGCAGGLVERNAVPGDRVCVTPQSRDRAAADNLTRQARMLAPS